MNLHPLKLDKIPFEYDGVLDRKNDIMFHDRTEFDENVAVLISDYVSLGKELVKLAEENGVSREKVQKILQEKAKSVQWDTGKHITYDDLIKGQVDVDFVIRMERKNDVHTISNKTFDFSTTTVRQLIHDGYMECKESLISSGVISSKGN